ACTCIRTSLPGFVLSHRNARAVFSDIEPALSVFRSRKLDRTLAVKPLVGIREALEEGECDLTIDHNTFLMLRGAQGKTGIALKPYPTASVRRELSGRVPFALHGVQRDMIPNQNVDLERGFGLKQRGEKGTKLDRKAIIRAAGWTDQR